MSTLLATCLKKNDGKDLNQELIPLLTDILDISISLLYSLKIILKYRLLKCYISRASPVGSPNPAQATLYLSQVNH